MDLGSAKIFISKKTEIKVKIKMGMMSLSCFFITIVYNIMQLFISIISKKEKKWLILTKFLILEIIRMANLM